ncbi:MAG: biotin/lipoyl-binding protein, partial [Sphingobacteriales bacterium]
MKRIASLLGIAGVLCAAACTSVKKEQEENAKYAVTTPLKIDTSLVKEYVSQIKSVRNIELRAQEKGYLEQILVDEGQSVRAGQLLFRIMPKIYQAELLKAEAEAREAEIEYQNT